VVGLSGTSRGSNEAESGGSESPSHQLWGLEEDPGGAAHLKVLSYVLVTGDGLSWHL